MRSIYLFLLLSGPVLAQVPPKAQIRRDSVLPGEQMPTFRPRNDFYRRPGDHPNVVRATLDNMPVWVSDTSAVAMPTRGRRVLPNRPENFRGRKRN
jgi:hypothetical protein